MYPDDYLCIALEQSEKVVVDVDNKGGKDGNSTLTALTKANEWPETLMTRTPNDGYHYMFSGKSVSSGANKLGPGVDIPVMVPLPGSEVKGKGSYTIVHRRPIAPLPEWVKTKAGATVERSPTQQKPLTELDKDYNVQQASHYLSEEPPAIESKGGNNRTYKAIQRVRDYGISEGLCLSLVQKHYNNRCVPPWSDDELIELITHAYQYAKSQAGTLDPAVDFGPITEEKRTNMFISMGDVLKAGDLAPEWVIKNYFEKDTVSLLYGDTGTYKSFLAMDIGIHVALGRDWHGHKVKTQGKVCYLASEGRGGLKRRLAAWCRHYGVDSTTVPFYILRYNISLDSSKTIKVLLEDINELSSKGAASDQTAMVIIDTLAKSFGQLDENSSKDMGAILKRSEFIRESLYTHVMLIHHTGHTAKDRPRGSYALMAGVDAYFRIWKSADEISCLEKAGKMKDGVSAPNKWFSPMSINLGVDEDGDPITSLVMDLMPEGYTPPVSVRGIGPAQQWLNDTVVAAGIIEQGNLFERYGDYCVKEGRECRKQNFNKSMKRLMERGVVILEKGNYKIVGGCKALEGLLE